MRYKAEVNMSDAIHNNHSVIDTGAPGGRLKGERALCHTNASDARLIAEALNEKEESSRQAA